jgi:hypothetical protein
MAEKRLSQIRPWGKLKCLCRGGSFWRIISMGKSRQKMKVIGLSRPIMFKVKFLADCGDGEFTAGDVRELKAASANHWIKRGLAKKFVEKPKRKPGRPPKKKEEAKEVEKKTDTLELPSSPPITVTDPTPELEKE